jgi:hypothetical protein
VFEAVVSTPNANYKSTTERSSIKSVPWWVSSIVLLGAFLLSAGAVIALIRPAMLVTPHDEINGAVRVYAGYLTSRNLGLAIMLVFALVLRARKALSVVMLLVAIIQFLDVGIDCFEGRWSVVPGIIVLGTLFLIGAARVSGQPFWKIED